MKLFNKAALIGAFAVSSFTPAFAQSAMHVNVPFDFMVGNEKFAAGEYQVQSATETGVVYIQGTGHSAAVITSPVEIANPEVKASLVFENSNEGAHLVKIQMEGEYSRAVPFRNSVKLTASR